MKQQYVQQQNYQGSDESCHTVTQRCDTWICLLRHVDSIHSRPNYLLHLFLIRGSRGSTRKLLEKLSFRSDFNKEHASNLLSLCLYKGREFSITSSQSYLF